MKASRKACCCCSANGISVGWRMAPVWIPPVTVKLEPSAAVPSTVLERAETGARPLRAAMLVTLCASASAMLIANATRASPHPALLMAPLLSPVSSDCRLVLHRQHRPARRPRFDAARRIGVSSAMLAPILSIQSHVVLGHVGNSAAVFALQRLGREVWPIMTVQFPSHTGYAGWRGRAFDAGMIDECVAGLEAIGALARCAGLLTGYLGKAEVGEAALRAFQSIRAANGEAAYACDPVIGRAGRGSYVAEGVAEFFHDRALPLATIATPNAFELEWLTGEPVRDLWTARGAIAALRQRGPRVVVAKSLRLEDTPADALDMLAGDEAGFWRLRTPKLPIAVNGAGDLFAALFFHHWLKRRATDEALSLAASSVHAIVKATETAGSRELVLLAAQDELVRPSRLFTAEAV